MSKEARKPIALVGSAEKVDRVSIFTIDDKEYTVPANPQLNVSMKYLDVLRRTDNQMFAAMQLLESMLGEADYQELLDFDGLTDEVLGQILAVCIELAFEKAEDAVKN